MPNLSTLTNDQLEDLWCETYDDTDLLDGIVLELMQRPDFAPSDYDLQWEMEDMGWNGGVTQDERDAR